MNWGEKHINVLKKSRTKGNNAFPVWNCALNDENEMEKDVIGEKIWSLFVNVFEKSYKLYSLPKVEQQMACCHEIIDEAIENGCIDRIVVLNQLFMKKDIRVFLITTLLTICDDIIWDQFLCPLQYTFSSPKLQRRAAGVSIYSHSIYDFFQEYESASVVVEHIVQHECTITSNYFPSALFAWQIIDIDPSVAIEEMIINDDCYQAGDVEPLICNDDQEIYKKEWLMLVKENCKNAATLIIVRSILRNQFAATCNLQDSFVLVLEDTEIMTDLLLDSMDEAPVLLKQFGGKIRNPEAMRGIFGIAIASNNVEILLNTLKNLNMLFIYNENNAKQFVTLENWPNLIIACLHNLPVEQSDRSKDEHHIYSLLLNLVVNVILGSTAQPRQLQEFNMSEVREFERHTNEHLEHFMYLLSCGYGTAIWTDIFVTDVLQHLLSNISRNVDMWIHDTYSANWKRILGFANTVRLFALCVHEKMMSNRRKSQSDLSSFQHLFVSVNNADGRSPNDTTEEEKIDNAIDDTSNNNTINTQEKKPSTTDLLNKGWVSKLQKEMEDEFEHMDTILEKYSVEDMFVSPSITKTYPKPLSISDVALKLLKLKHKRNLCQRSFVVKNTGILANELNSINEGKSTGNRLTIRRKSMKAQTPDLGKQKSDSLLSKSVFNMNSEEQRLQNAILELISSTTQLMQRLGVEPSMESKQQSSYDRKHIFWVKSATKSFTTLQSLENGIKTKQIKITPHFGNSITNQFWNFKRQMDAKTIDKKKSFRRYNSIDEMLTISGWKKKFGEKNAGKKRRRSRLGSISNMVKHVGLSMRKV